MNRPLLSLITITKDDPAGLARTLKSAERWRAFPDVEHIVVFAGDVPQIVPDATLLVRRQTGTGIAAAFNEGLALAQGEWVWFLNGGDAICETLAPGWLLDLLQQAMAADMIMGGVIYDQDTVPRWHPPIYRLWPLVDSWIAHPSSIIKRSLFARHGRFDDSYYIAMDFEWWLRVLSREARIDLISVPLARFAQGGLSQKVETQGAIACERARALRRHHRSVWRGFSRQALRFIWQWLRAMVQLRHRGSQHD